MRPEATELYTVILDYNGGTYASQVSGRDETAALSEWADRLVSEELVGQISEEVAMAFQASPNDLVPLEGLVSIWCGSTVAKAGLAIVNIVKTAA